MTDSTGTVSAVGRDAKNRLIIEINGTGHFVTDKAYDYAKKAVVGQKVNYRLAGGKIDYIHVTEQAAPKKDIKDGLQPGMNAEVGKRPEVLTAAQIKAAMDEEARKIREAKAAQEVQAGNQGTIEQQPAEPCTSPSPAAEKEPSPRSAAEIQAEQAAREAVKEAAAPLPPATSPATQPSTIESGTSSTPSAAQSRSSAGTHILTDADASTRPSPMAALDPSTRIHLEVTVKTGPYESLRVGIDGLASQEPLLIQRLTRTLNQFGNDQSAREMIQAYKQRVLPKEATA